MASLATALLGRTGHPATRLGFGAMELGGIAGALPEGQVVFQHSTGEAAATKFGADGKYTVDVPQGKNQVMVRSVESSKLPEAGRFLSWSALLSTLIGRVWAAAGSCIA